MPSFRYRERRAEDGWHNASPGDTLRLRETGTYSLHFPEALSVSERLDLAGLGFEILDPQILLASFGNFVGTTRVRDVQITVESAKLGLGGMSALLQETVELAAELIYGWGSPLGTAATRSGRADRRVPYHDFLFLRHELLKAKVGQRLQDHFAVVATQPTRRLIQDYVTTASHKARRFDRRTFASLASAARTLTVIGSANPFYEHPLARALESSSLPGVRFMPLDVTMPVRVESFDTPENRFVRHLLVMCQGVVGRFLEHPKLHAGLRRDARLMSELLQSMSDSALLEDVALPSGVISPTQALAKGDGYRELFNVYRSLLERVSLPATREETQRFLDGKDVATLYEYWVFLKIVECLRNILHELPSPRLDVVGGEMGVLLARGLTVRFTSGIEVSFNKTFSHSPPTASYSTSFRPDIIVRRGENLVVFDAKYRLDSIDLREEDADDDSSGTGTQSWKRVDLHKMHAYRDAIKDVSSAFVVYPGDQFVFFDVAAGQLGDAAALTGVTGVGALPLRPGNDDDRERLATVLFASVSF